MALFHTEAYKRDSGCPDHFWVAIGEKIWSLENWTSILQLSEKLYQMEQINYFLLYYSTILCRIYCSQMYTACLKWRNVQL
jgi:hypothetical protein